MFTYNNTGVVYIKQKYILRKVLQDIFLAGNIKRSIVTGAKN
jgi:hypothetical protein